MKRDWLLAGLLTGFLTAECAAEPFTLPLWSEGAPGSEARRHEPEQAESYWVRNIHCPSLTAFLPPPEKTTGAAVIVVPGGGHRELVFQAEGVKAAEFLSKLGIVAFALKYRLAREQGSSYSLREHARADALRAVRTVRSRADEWGINPHRIGMLGFSAGGEVVALVAYEANPGNPQSTDPIERVSGRPDFQMLVYPGPLGIPRKIPADAPTLFLVCANDDRGHIEPVVDLLIGYRAVGAPVEAHIYAHGGHAFNMGNRSRLKTISSWPDRMADWLADNGYLGTSDGATTE